MNGIFRPATFLAAKTLTLSLSLVARTAFGVDVATIEVTGPIDAPAVAIPAGQATTADTTLGTEGFFVDAPSSVTGEFPIRIGANSSNDAADGVLISSIYEIGREIPFATGGDELVFASPGTVRDDSSHSVNARPGTGGLSLTARRAGIADALINGTSVPGGEPISANMAAAYFPFRQGWVGGTFSSSTVSGSGDGVTYGDFDQFNGSAGLGLTSIQQDFYSPGYHKITIPGVTDSRRQGILLTTTADNAGRFSAAAPTVDGSGFVVATVDNDNFFSGDPDKRGEDDGRLTPVSMVFLPVGTPHVTMGAIHGGTGRDIQPTPLVRSGESFSITREDAGQYRLSIPGESPTSGVLVVTPGGNGSGMGGRVADNIVTSRPDGNDWLILSEDPEADSAYTGTFASTLEGRGQDNTGMDQYFSFAFFFLRYATYRSGTNSGS